jgi:hypothetical protein
MLTRAPPSSRPGPVGVVGDQRHLAVVVDLGQPLGQLRRQLADRAEQAEAEVLGRHQPGAPAQGRRVVGPDRPQPHAPAVLERHQLLELDGVGPHREAPRRVARRRRRYPDRGRERVQPALDRQAYLQVDARDLGLLDHEPRQPHEGRHRRRRVGQPGIAAPQQQAADGRVLQQRLGQSAVERRKGGRGLAQ